MSTPTTVGFTGTQTGMTYAQQSVLHDLLIEVEPGVFHHGMCHGADDEASRIAHLLGWHVIGHPGYGRDHKPRFHGYTDEALQPHPFLVRNHHIVDATARLIAGPRGAEVVRSGTWATVRYARRQGRKLDVIHPDGRLS